MRYAEFCAGVGGFRLGLESSGADVQLVYSNEIDCHCEKTYESNFNQKFDSKDIFSVDATLIPDFDMLCAGFPCQPFSVAGKELGFADSRGTVFFKLLEIIKIKKPGIVFLENVPNLVHHRGGFTYKAIIDATGFESVRQQCPALFSCRPSHDFQSRAGYARRLPAIAFASRTASSLLCHIAPTLAHGAPGSEASRVVPQAAFGRHVGPVRGLIQKLPQREKPPHAERHSRA